jgi:hypothetical protein
MNISYDKKRHNNFTEKINAAFFYTINVSKLASALFTYVYKSNTGVLKRCLHGRVEQLICTDTCDLTIMINIWSLILMLPEREKHGRLYFPKIAKRLIR